MYVIAIDQGTTSTRTLAFDREGTVQAHSQVELQQYFPGPGWVEHDAEEIWHSVEHTLRKVVDQMAPRRPVSIGIANQRETAVVWDRRSGRPVYRAIVWQSRQSADICARMRAEGLSETVRDRTGLVIDPYFSATKIAWILEHVPGARQQAEAGHLLFGTIDTWLIWKLTGGRVHATDYSNASRTLLYDIHRRCWDAELCSALQIPLSMLPEVRDSSGDFGADTTGIPIAGCAGDQQAALFGQACFEAGMVKNTYGTGCFMLLNTGSAARQSAHGLLTTLAWGINGQVIYALEGSIFVAGAAVQWMRDTVEWVSQAAETEQYAEMVPSTAGVYVVPAFVGLGTPYWDTSVRGAIFGLTRASTRAHLVRATLESVAYQVKDVLDAMSRDAAMPIAALRVDGGMVSNAFLMQFQSDMLGLPVERARIQETTALGAAFLAGLAHGFWKDQREIQQMVGPERRFEPNMPRDEAGVLYAGWCRAVAAARTF
jgi:glycerol kinase